MDQERYEKGKLNLAQHDAIFANLHFPDAVSKTITAKFEEMMELGPQIAATKDEEAKLALINQSKDLREMIAILIGSIEDAGPCEVCGGVDPAKFFKDIFLGGERVFLQLTNGCYISVQKVKGDVTVLQVRMVHL